MNLAELREQLVVRPDPHQPAPAGSPGDQPLL
jgi:hypothetical protein